MILIIGGKHQGRLRFAAERFGLDKTDVFDCELERIDGGTDKKIIYNIEYFFKTCEFDELLRLYQTLLYDKIVITAETGCGLVPIDKNERAMREKNGRANCALAQRAESVYRVIYGIGERIK